MGFPSNLVPTTIISAAATLLISAYASAQENPEVNTQKTLDRIEQKIDKLDEQNQQIKESVHDSLLGERKHGVEFNFFRILIFGEDGQRSLSGGYSYFDHKNKVEIAVPWIYHNDNHEDYYEAISDEKLLSVNVGLHYRKYLSHRLSGFYISGFARMNHMKGVEDNSYGFYYYDVSPPESIEKTSETKLGLGVGIGYRAFSSDGFYWGVSLNVGRYIVGETDVFESTDTGFAELDDNEIIVDIELLKFGYAF